MSVAPLASHPFPGDNKKAPPHQRDSTRQVLFSSEPIGKFVSAAPAFPLPSATLAKRVSDRERKDRGEQPTVQSVVALRQDMEAERGDILGKATDGVERDLVRVAADVLALGQDAVRHRDDLATAGLGLVNVDELAR